MGVRVHDRATGKTLEVPSDQAQEGLLRGNYDLLENRSKVVRYGNQTGSVATEDLPNALGAGWRLSDPEEVASVKLRREESDAASQAQGLTEQALSGATFGLSDLALEAMGVDPARMRAREEGLGAGADLANIAGAIVPGLLTGGAGTAASLGRGAARAGARALSAPVRGLEALGGVAERAAARAVSGAESSLVRRAIPMGARGAVEGVGYGLGAEIHESVLGERDITAERLAAGGLMGGALGGAFGLVLPGVTDVAAGLARAPAEAMRKVVGRSSGAPGGEGSGLVARILSDKNAERYAAGLGLNPESSKKIFGLIRTKEGRARFERAAYHGDDAVEAMGRDIQGHLQSTNDALEAAIIGSQGKSKVKNVARLMPAGADKTSSRFALDKLDNIDKQLARLESEGIRYHQPDIRSARERIEKAFLDTYGEKKAASHFRALERTKQDLDILISKRNKQLAKSSAETDTIEALSSVRKQLKEHLEDEQVWGAAGSAQREINSALSAEFAAKKELGRGKLAKMLDKSGEVDSMTALQLARQYGRGGRESQFAKIDDIIDRRLEVLDAIEKHYELPSETLAEFSKARAAAENYRKTLEGKAELAGDIADLMHLRKVEGGGSPSITLASTLGPTTGALLGSTLGPVGAAIGAIAGRATAPYNTARTLASLLNLTDKIKGAHAVAIGQFVKKVTGGAARATQRAGRALGESGAARKAVAMGGSRAISSSDRREALAQRRKRAAVLATNPGQLVHEMRATLHDVAKAAPGVAAQLQLQIQRGAEFLSAKAPAVFESPWTGGGQLVDPVALDRYERYVEAVEDPGSVFEAMADGTVSYEAIEALREVYPKLYEQAQTQVMDELTAAYAEGREVPFDARVQIGVMFGIETDPSLGPDAQALIANSHAAAPPPPPPAAAQPQGSRPMRPMSGKTSERYMTGIDRLESGGERI